MCPHLRHLFGAAGDPFGGGDVLSRRVFDAVREYLSGAISGLIFLIRRMDEGVENQGEDALHLYEIEDELSTKAEQCPLFGPVGR